MKKKTAFLFILTGAALLFAGCSAIQTANSSTFNGQRITATGTGVAHISGSCSGLYLLWIPLITGSVENPNSIVFGEDSCNVNAVTSMVTAKSRSLGAAKTLDLVSTRESSTIPVFFCFRWRTVMVSGNAAN